MVDRLIRLAETGSCFWVLATNDTSGVYTELNYTKLLYPDPIAVLGAFGRGDYPEENKENYRSIEQWSRTFPPGAKIWPIDL